MQTRHYFFLPIVIMAGTSAIAAIKQQNSPITAAFPKDASAWLVALVNT